MADRAATIMDQIRSEARVFEASRLKLVGLLDATNGQYTAMGGNTLTDAYLDAHGSTGTVDQVYNMSKAEWQAFWPTLRTVITVSQANLASLMKGLLTPS